MSPYNDNERNNPEWEEDDELEATESFDEDEDAEAEDDDEAESDDFTSDEVLEEIAGLIEEAEEFCDRGEFRKAIRMWRRHIDRFSDEPIVFFHLARCTFRLLGEEVLSGGAWDSSAEASILHEEVLSTLDEALVMDPDYVEALNLLGAAHMMRDDHKEAIKAWEKSIKLDEDQPDVEADLKEARRYLR